MPSMKYRVEDAIKKLAEGARLHRKGDPEEPPFGPMPLAGLVFVNNAESFQGDWLIQKHDFSTVVVIAFDLPIGAKVGTVTLHPPKSDGEQGKTFTIVYDDAADAMDALLSELDHRITEAVASL